MSIAEYIGLSIAVIFIGLFVAWRIVSKDDSGCCSGDCCQGRDCDCK